MASGSGLVEILKSLGADVVVSGGQTMNPSTKDIVDAIASVNADRVIVLPNNKNIVMAANAAATVSDRPVAVVPTHAVPEAFAALLALEPDQADLQDAATAMERGCRARPHRRGHHCREAGDVEGGQDPRGPGHRHRRRRDRGRRRFDVQDVALELSDVLVTARRRDAHRARRRRPDRRRACAISPRSCRSAIPTSASKPTAASSRCIRY